MSGSKGFTLLELMIAIMLFAMISAAAYKLFDSVSRAQQVTDGILDYLDEIQRAQLILEKDLFQMTARPVRDEFGDSQPAVVSPSLDGFALEFTRAGWRNPLKELRSNLQRVAYNLEEDELVRYYWLMLDRAPDPILIRQVILNNVHGLKVRFMNEKKRWSSSWPPAKQSRGGKPAGRARKTEDPVMPYAIELTVKHVDFGTLVTILPALDYKSSDALKWPEQEQGSDQRNAEQNAHTPKLDQSDDGQGDDNEDE
ncbi:MULTISPECIES: type II secretion system minor pseudopilin GspJ [unclassified Endozoicomonas]|uniref:type II secretion system minor pseudopilin GspJ n=1 Tax=unclassified Endozoicomonas TaxID=2644528 RepID=UPI002148598C|nr:MULTISPECIES: type II secretion system minor pseudopilin GspJ [unclassified Endozoicomonas]